MQVKVRPGDIGFSGKRKGFYPNAVRFFTKSRWSHCFVVTPEFLGELSVIEASLCVQVVPFQREYVENNNDYYEIYRPIKATANQVEASCKALYISDAGATYGFLQIPWFAIRAILRPLGFELRSNWLPSGEICSETLWHYLMGLGDEYAEAFSAYTENECSPQDLAKIAKSRPDLFEFVIERI